MRPLFFLLASLFIHCILACIFFSPRWQKISFSAGERTGTSSVEIVQMVVQEEGREKIVSLPKPRSRGNGSNVETGTSEVRGASLGSSRNPDSTASVLSVIRDRIQRAKHYPLLAERQGLGGAVEVTFEIDEEGQAQHAQVLRSSSSEILDQAALETIKRGGPYPAYPAPLNITLEFKPH